MIDVDRWPTKTLSNVAASALQYNYQLAISNPCFEVWLLCHFQSPPEQATECKAIATILREAMGGSYDKARLNLDCFKDKITFTSATAKATDPSPNDRWPIPIGTHVYKVVNTILALQERTPCPLPSSP